MEKLKTLSEQIDASFKDVRLTPAIKQAILDKCSHQKPIRKSFVLAATTLIALFTTLVFFNLQTVTMAAKPILQYIYGTNEIISDGNTTPIFAMEGSVTLKTPEGYIEVQSCYQQDRTVHIALQSTCTLENNISFEDGKGNKVKSVEVENIASEESLDKSDFRMFGSYKIELENSTEQINLKWKDYDLPIVMAKVPEAEDFKDLGNACVKDGITLVAFTQYKDELLEVKLVGRNSNGVLMSHIDSPYLVDMSGKEYGPVSPPSDQITENTFYFDAKLKDGLKVIVPRVLEPKLGMKKTMVLDIEHFKPIAVDWEPYALKIKSIQRGTGKSSFSVKNEEGGRTEIPIDPAMGLTITVDPYSTNSTNQGVQSYNYDCDPSYKSVTLKHNSEATKYICMTKRNEDGTETITLPGFPANQNTLEMTFDGLVIFHKSNWIIHLEK